MTSNEFRDEFVEFTQKVAGRMEFGIYANYLDNLFATPRVPINAKAVLVVEILGFPRMIRRELITNLLTSRRAPNELVSFAERAIRQSLDTRTATDIMLLRTLKSARGSIRQMKTQATPAEAAISGMLAA